MRRFFAFGLLALIASLSSAQTIDLSTAREAGLHFLQQKGVAKQGDTLTLATTDRPTAPNYYVFNHAGGSFVIVSADDRCLPILGYSTSGCFDPQRLPENMRQWLQGYSVEIQQGRAAQAPPNKANLARWEQLLQPVTADPEALATKEDDYLLTSTWEQGSGYNNYCPMMNGEHVVVGCVATAMAQIIRYYGYPTRGFGHKTHYHSVYGALSVNFDTTDYDYSLMPDRIRRSSSTAQRNMVSLLCYHCGIVVNMEYQHAGHTSGSGAHTSDVPNGLRYFGYTSAQHYQRNVVNNDSLWDALIRNEIDHRRPIEYSGFSNEGGHAFVLDGYNNNQQYHFNWGWGGYADGFYSLSTMVGFTSSHEMVINITPSGWDGHLEHFHVATSGNGNGTSWQQANADLESAVALSGLVDRDIWMKEGTYYGDTTANYAFTISAPATLLGGFEGTETSSSERNPKLHPTLLDGGGQRGVLKAQYYSSASRMLKLDGITLQNGHSVSDPVVRLAGNLSAARLDIRQCTSDSGLIVSADETLLVGLHVHDNAAPTICVLDGATMRQSLLVNNSGNTLVLDGRSRVINSDILSGSGIGVTLRHRRISFVNNLVWNHDTALVITAELPDTAVRYCAIESDTAFADSTLVRLDADNMSENGPRFLQPNAQRGRRAQSESEDWHLGRGSVCIDAGQRVSESLRDGDMDQTLRCRNGHIDIGCYESNYPVGIDHSTLQSTLAYPNPARTSLTVNCQPGQTVSLFDAAGRLIARHTSADGCLHLRVADMPNGIYFIASGERMEKVVVEH